MGLTQETAWAFNQIGQKGWVRDISSSHRSLLQSIASVRKFEQGQSIFEIDRPASGMIGVVTGSIRLSLSRPSGDSYALYRPGPGFWIGNYPILAGEPHMLSCWAAEPTQLIWIPGGPLLKLLDKHPSLHWAFHQLTYRQIKNVLEVKSQLTGDTSLARVAGRLLLEARSRATEADWIRISQAELAEMLAMSLPTLQRAVSRLAEEDLIEVGYGQIRISDKMALENISRRSKP